MNTLKIRHPVRLLAAVLSAAALGQAHAGAAFTVNYVHPESYTDATYRDNRADTQDRDAVLGAIGKHLEALAGKNLQPGQSLAIDVLDVDLAGRFEPMRGPALADVRILTDIDWPRITLRYTLKQGEQVVASAEERVSDMNYLTSNRYSTGDRLRYEKAMLDDWFQRRIAASH